MNMDRAFDTFDVPQAARVNILQQKKHFCVQGAKIGAATFHRQDILQTRHFIDTKFYRHDIS